MNDWLCLGNSTRWLEGCIVLCSVTLCYLHVQAGPVIHNSGAYVISEMHALFLIKT